MLVKAAEGPSDACALGMQFDGALAGALDRRASRSSVVGVFADR